jgi:5,10-methylenetetrahydrofolate reductase
MNILEKPGQSCQSADRFRERLAGKRFCYGAELVTTRGFVAPQQPSPDRIGAGKVLELGEQLCSDSRIDWVSITDNPGGNVMLPPDWLARLLARTRASIVVHLSCKDMNRNALESAIWRYASEGVENILAMTGDYPRSGYGGNAGPVFDLDSVGLITLLNAMNRGLPVPGRKGETTILPKTNFFIGCVVSPFKWQERELLPQYFKLQRKIASGAQFVYTQLGYDMRKFYEVKLVLAAQKLNVPVIGNVYLLNKTVAGMFHRNEVPGCVVTDRLMALAEKYGAGPDKGRSFFYELAAKQLAVFKGLGFAGGYLGGITKPEVFFELIDRAEKFGENDWKEFAKEIQFANPNEFYLYEADAVTGLGDRARMNPAQSGINPEYSRSLQNPRKTKQVTLSYRFSRFMHDEIFLPDTTGFRMMKRLYSRWDKKPGFTANIAHQLEKLSKFVLYGCEDCGDCSLPDCTYLCPRHSCSKDCRNGPCGGSHDGICELDDKDCIWARAYDRLKHYHESEQMLKGPTIFYNAALKNTSAWANTFLGYDHFHHGNVGRAWNTFTPKNSGSTGKEARPMPIPGLTIIGESINDSVPSTKVLFDANDINGLLALAKTQDEKGAGYIDVNVGRRTPEFMADLIRKIQSITAKPVSVDTPDIDLAAAGLKAYDRKRAGGRLPILNSISPLRLKMFDLYKTQPFMPIMLVSERLERGEAAPNLTAEETYRTAKQMLQTVRQLGSGIPNNQLIIDPGIAPIGTDSEGNFKRLLGALKMIHDDPDFAGVHRSVGLSNFTVMLPSRRADGSPVKGPLESAFLTLAMPLGLDMIIGSTVRKYELLSADRPAMVCLQDVLKLEGFDAIERIREFYS